MTNPDKRKLDLLSDKKIDWRQRLSCDIHQYIYCHNLFCGKYTLLLTNYGFVFLIYEQYIPFDFIFTNQINLCRFFYPMLHWTNGKNKTEQTPAIMITKTNTKFTAVKETKTLYKKKWMGTWGIFAGLLSVCQYLNVRNRWLFFSPMLFWIDKLFFIQGSAGRGLHLPSWGYRPLQTSRHPISWRHFHRFGPSAVYNLHKIGTKMFEICAEMWHNITIAWCMSLPR